MFKFLNSKKGFTLMELLVIVAILGILTAVAIPLFNNVTGSSKKKICKVVCRNIESRIITVAAQGQTHPDDDVMKLKTIYHDDGTYSTMSANFTIVSNEDGTDVAGYEGSMGAIFTKATLTPEDEKFANDNHISPDQYALEKTFKSIFDDGKVPCCPVGEGRIKVVVQTTEKPGLVKVTATCDKHPQ